MFVTINKLLIIKKDNVSYYSEVVEVSSLEMKFCSSSEIENSTTKDSAVNGGPIEADCFCFSHLLDGLFF